MPVEGSAELTWSWNNGHSYWKSLIACILPEFFKNLLTNFFAVPIRKFFCKNFVFLQSSIALFNLHWKNRNPIDLYLPLIWLQKKTLGCHSFGKFMKYYKYDFGCFPWIFLDPLIALFAVFTTMLCIYNIPTIARYIWA